MIMLNEITHVQEKTENRPTKNYYYLGIAKAVAMRSTCLRRKYGAVIVKDDRIVATGYNGSPRGDVNCVDIGTCKRESMKIPHGERYELCNAVHAECNALLQCNPNDAKDSTLYLFGFERDDNGNNIRITAEPCMMCRRIIRNMRVKTLIGGSGTDGYYKRDLDKEDYNEC